MEPISRNMWLARFATVAMLLNIIVAYASAELSSTRLFYTKMGFQMGQGSLLALWCVHGSQKLNQRISFSLLALVGITIMGATEATEPTFPQRTEFVFNVISTGLMYAVSALSLIIVRAVGKQVLALPQQTSQQRNSQFNVRTLLVLTLVVAITLALLRLFGVWQFMIDSGKIIVTASVMVLVGATIAATLTLPMAWVVLSPHRKSRVRALCMSAIGFMVSLSLLYFVVKLYVAQFTEEIFEAMLLLGFSSTATTCLGLVALRWLGYRLSKLPLQ